MARKQPADRISDLQKRRDQITAQLKALEARENQAARKAETRRKVIAGALALEHMEANPDSEFASILKRLLTRYVKRPADRALFKLGPLDPAEAEAKQPKQRAAQ